MSAEKPAHDAAEGPEEPMETEFPVGAEAGAEAEEPSAPKGAEAKAEAKAGGAEATHAATGAEAKAKAKAGAEARERDQGNEREKDDERLATLEAREKELVERLARLQADFENYRRRSREDIASAAARGKMDLLKTLLPVLDNLDRALAHTEDEGLRLLAKHLHATLGDAGLVLLDPTGEAFDAKAHEAIAQEAREGVKSGTVVATVEKGYALEGKILRPARVIVAG